MQFEKIKETATLNPCDEQSSSDHNVAIVERDIAFVDFKEMSEEQQNIVATWLHTRTETVDNMLTVKEEEVNKKHLGIVALRYTQDETWEIAGYIGAMAPEEHNGTKMSEVGSLYVEQSYRKHEVLVDIDKAEGKSNKALMRLSQALSHYATVALETRGIQPYAFCNRGSLPIFKRLEYAESTLRDVPTAAGDLCKTSCELYQACHPDKCCDTIVVKPLNNSHPDDSVILTV